VSYNTGSLVTRVQQRIRDTGYSSAEIKGYINDAQNDVYNEYRLRFMEDSEDYTLTVGTADLTSGTGLPTNYVQALDIINTTSGKEATLTYTDIRNINDLTTTGIPTSWYIFDDTINLYPIPISADTVKLRYYKKPVELSDDSDVPEIPSEFQELLVMGAAYRCLQVKDNYDQAGILQNKYDEILDKLVYKYSQSQVGQPNIMRINRNATSKTNF
jgi:hypothetical protein